ncbi:hypothetical protein HGRIS_005860 [Hohenbuehelia grisea]|uniref:Secreted protein n=1 Tax=Hohenbuehelia grisea TaxID=104357 RepID=A0ABR3JY31_9AGAR
MSNVKTLLCPRLAQTFVERIFLAALIAWVSLDRSLADTPRALNVLQFRTAPMYSACRSDLGQPVRRQFCTGRMKMITEDHIPHQRKLVPLLGRHPLIAHSISYPHDWDDRVMV